MARHALKTGYSMAEIPIVDLQLNDAALHALPSILDKQAERAVKQVGLLTEAKAVQLAPFAKFTGKKKGTNLKNSGTTEFSGSGFNTSAKVKFTAPYALFVHEGTGIFGPLQKPFTVEPKKKKALFWTGAPHPFKKVTIKGMKARPFLKQAAEEEFPKLRELVFG